MAAVLIKNEFMLYLPQRHWEARWSLMWQVATFPRQSSFVVENRHLIIT